MECNKEEARKAIEIAERKLSENDHNGAKRFVSKAKTLYPIIDGLEQISTMIHVYASASNKTSGSESDWYGILSADPLADEETLKKQYKKLALLLHPDKNKFNGAEGAFKLVLHAWSLLSDKAKRVAYDHKRKRKERNNEPTPPPPPPASDRENQKRAERRFKKQQEKRAQQEETADKAKEESSSRKKKVGSTFWTMCTHCSTYYEHVRAHYLDKNTLCPFCSKVFVATEKFPEMVNGKPYIRFAPPPPKPQATKGNASDTRNSMPKTPCPEFARTFWTMCTHCLTYSEHVRADHLDKNSLCPFCGRVFVATEKFPEMLNGKPYIRFAPPPPPKRQATSDTRNSVPKTPCSRFDDLNSTHEAQRLFSRSGRTSTVR